VNGGTAASLVTKLNSEFDTKFGVGKVVASGVSGGNLTISTAGSPNDGKVPTIQMEYPYAFKSTLIKKFDDFIDALQRNDNDGIDAFLKGVDEELNNVLTLRSDIGARANRVELVQRRIDDNQISFTKLLSSAEDANMAEVVMYLKNSENVYKASLSTGGRVIQPSLIDFLK